MTNRRGALPGIPSTTEIARCGALVCSLLLAITAGSLSAQIQTATCPTGFGEVVAPPGILPPVVGSLKLVPNPVIKDGPAGPIPEELAEYVANIPAAIRLGKALFWDMQVGSDNKTACATCHHHAGGDSRSRNTINPGPNSGWDTVATANAQLRVGDFPFASFGHDNISGSQGVRNSTFGGFNSAGAELNTPAGDPLFQEGGKNTRRVTGMHSPSVINAVFNHRNFWNGRAQPEFNGVNVWGARDTASRVWVLDANGIPVQRMVRIPDPLLADPRFNASLASQAVGPPLDASEMSGAGRKFADIGKKLLILRPLGLQRVDSTDSVLGFMADNTTPASKGLRTTYAAMVQTAFLPKWWRTSRPVAVGGTSYTMMQANFSLFYGLALMLYQSTLVSDDSPMDQYLMTRLLDLAGNVTAHNPALLDGVVQRMQADSPGITRQHILDGLALFEKPVSPPPFTFPPAAGTGVGCIACHLGAELTSASVRNIGGRGVEEDGQVFRDLGFDGRMERMFMQIPPVPIGTTDITFDPSNYAVNVTGINGVAVTPQAARVATYDAGWYNIGLRPDADNLGLGGVDAFGRFLSWTRFLQNPPNNPANTKVPGAGLGCLTANVDPINFPNTLLNNLVPPLPLLSGPLRATEASAVEASFKVPGLRNLELTGPYMHNGSQSTLMQSMEFYDDGGTFTSPSKAPLIRALGMTEEQMRSLVAFFISLTDERVRFERAPFDHPSLELPEGQDANGNDIIRSIPAVGAGGRNEPLPRFLNLNPFAR